VTIDGHPYHVSVTAPSVEIAAQVAVAPGANSVDVVVEDIVGRKTTRTISLEIDADGPAITFDPQETAKLLTGFAYDPAGVSSLRIGGDEATLEPDDQGVVRFLIPIDPLRVTLPIPFVCADGLGNRSYGEVPDDALVMAKGESRLVVADAVYGFAASTRTTSFAYQGASIAPRVVFAQVTPPRVAFWGIKEGDVFSQDDITVQVRVVADAPVENVWLQGRALRPIPGKSRQLVGGIVRLEPGPNAITVLVRAEDGGEAVVSVEVVRAEDDVTRMDRLNLLFENPQWRGDAPAQWTGFANQIVTGLSDWLVQERRCNIVERQAFEIIHRELVIDTTRAPEERSITQGQLEAADLVVVASMQHDSEVLQIALDIGGTSSTRGPVDMDSLVYADRLEVAGIAQSA
jgi:hypothetical protein